jgi:hypothetical protein
MTLRPDLFSQLYCCLHAKLVMRNKLPMSCALLAAIFLNSWLLGGVALAVAPTLTFPLADGLPGLQLPFNTLNGVNPFAGDVTVNYGKQATGNFGWLFDTFQGSSIESSGSLGRYSPTMFFSNDDPPPTVPNNQVCNPGTNLCPAGMLEDHDWIFHMEFRHRGAYDPADADFILSARVEPGFSGVTPGSSREDRVFAVKRGANANDWSILIGNNTGGFSPLVTNLQHPMDVLATPPEQYIDFDVHYRSDAHQMDFYWEDQLVGTGATGHGRYDIDFVQFEHKVDWEGVQDFRNFRLGNIGSTSAPIDGDYNDNGVVDAADYVIWRKNLDAVGLPGSVAGDGDDGTATGTPDGIVNQHDYTFWRSRYGATTPLGSGSGFMLGGSVPEPSALVLLTLVSMLIAPLVRTRA